MEGKNATHILMPKKLSRKGNPPAQVIVELSSRYAAVHEHGCQYGFQCILTARLNMR